MIGLVIAAILGVSSTTVGWDDLTQAQRHDATVILIDHHADWYGLSDSKKMQMLETISCEDGSFVSTQKSHFPGEESYGLSQINLPSHPDISLSNAVDPEFSIEFMAKAFSLNKQSMWSCWKDKYT